MVWRNIFLNESVYLLIDTWLYVVLYNLILSICVLIPTLISIAFFTLAERKIMASIQRRRGPNIVGIWGLLQPFADGVKVLIKEVVFPYQTNRFLFLLAPSLTFTLSIVNWALIPFTYTESLADLTYGLLYLYALSSFSVYGIILAGWVSQSKYPFLGAIRSAAQIISYEVSIGLIFVIVAFCAHSINFIDIVYIQETTGWYIKFLFPVAGIFFISVLAETNRAPFDLPEAEAEIVAGYNLEYSAIIFALFFLGEYGNIILMSIVFSLLFLGGWAAPFLVFECIYAPFWLYLKTVIICFLFVVVRATLPRYRYDQLINICWQIFLPINLLYLITVVVLFLL